MPDPYEELDVFGRPKSRVSGVPYVTPDDELIALQNYVLNLEAKEAAIESGARTVRKPKEIKKEGKRTPAYVHEYDPGYTASEEARLLDERDPVRFMPVVRQGVENVRAIYGEGADTPSNIFQKMTGAPAPQGLWRLQTQPTFEDRWNNNLIERTQTWPEKMVRSGASLPADVMSGRVISGPGLRATDFSDIPGAPNPLGPMIERTQDLAGLAMGGSVVDAARSVKPVPRVNVVDWMNQNWGAPVAKPPGGITVKDAKGNVYGGRNVALHADDEVGGAFSAARNAQRGLTNEFGGGNVPTSIARNIGRETMPEILSRQRASEGMEAAIRDPETKKLYTGMWHEEVLDKITKDRGVPKDQLPTNLVKGYVNDRGRFISEEQAERASQNKSKTAMFRADDEVGAAVAALHATEGKAPELKVGQANLPAVIPQGGGLMAPGSAINPISNRRGFLRGARDMVAAASNANKIVSMAEKLGAPQAVPKMPKVPLKEIWKTGEGVQEIPDHDASVKHLRSYFDEHVADPTWSRQKHEREFEKFGESDEGAAIFDEHFEDYNEEGGTQFSHHQLPGATNYREHLMQMPEQPNIVSAKAIEEKARKDYNDVHEANVALAKSRGPKFHHRYEAWEDLPQGVRDMYLEPTKRVLENQGKDPFYGDWDEPDIIGHSRVNDRQIPNVGKSLHIEEIGSQLHEKAAKYGHKGKPPDDIVAEESGNPGYAPGKTDYFIKNKNGDVVGRFAAKSKEEAVKLAKSYSESIPDLPFKKTHVDIAVNRMLHEAATQGYDAVSWTPHELQKKNYGNDSNKEVTPRIEALAKKYGGKVEKHKINTAIGETNKEYAIDAAEGGFKIAGPDGYVENGRIFKTKDEATKFMQNNTNDIHVLKLTPEMKRIFGHDDFSMFPKQQAAETGPGFKLRSDSEAGAAIGALKNAMAPTFYSGLGRTIERAPFETATPSQWAKHLRDTVGERQAEEFEHVGLEGKVGPLKEVKQEVQRPAQGALDEWKKANPKQRPPKELIDAASNENKRLVEQKIQDRTKEAPLTKAELLAHVKENQPKFKEIVKRGDQDSAEGAIHARALNIVEEDHPEITPRHPRYYDYFDEAVHRASDELEGSATKYSDYQLPGGTNYREHLMTMPDRRAATEADIKVGRARTDQQGNPVVGDQHFSSHWPEDPNVIVHTRLNDRELPGIGRSSHAEEFQSDLHQEGRKKGYKGAEPKIEEDKEYGQTSDGTKRWQVYLPNGEKSRFAFGKTKEDALNAVKSWNLPDFVGVPNLPFKKSWPDLAIKRWLREAVDNDYDAVSWTPGEAQRDRFRLSHHLQDLQYAKNQDGTYALLGINKNGGEVKVNRGMPVKEDELGRYVGDAVADKIKKGEGKLDEIDEFRTLNNEDLKVGGEGLMSFYDKTVKGKVEALVERFGGKVEKHSLNDVGSLKIAGTEPYISVENGHGFVKTFTTKKAAQEYIKQGGDFIWSVKLTPEMKAAIKREGFPLFSAGPVLTPVDHDPFDKKLKGKPKLQPVDHDPFAQPTPDLGGTLNKLISATGSYRPRPQPVQNGFGRRQ